jgi:hypothetical protein
MTVGGANGPAEGTGIAANLSAADFGTTTPTSASAKPATSGTFFLGVGPGIGDSPSHNFTPSTPQGQPGALASSVPVASPTSMSRPEDVDDSMSIDDVMTLLETFVCQGLREDRRSEVATILRKGTERYNLTGCALLADRPSPEKLAASLLKGRSFPNDADDDDKQDGVFWSTVRFIARSREHANAMASGGPTAGTPAGATAGDEGPLISSPPQLGIAPQN